MCQGTTDVISETKIRAKKEEKTVALGQLLFLVPPGKFQVFVWMSAPCKSHLGSVVTMHWIHGSKIYDACMLFLPSSDVSRGYLIY